MLPSQPKMLFFFVSVTFKAVEKANTLCALLALLNTSSLGDKLSCHHCECHLAGGAVCLCALHRLQHQPALVPSVLSQRFGEMCLKCIICVNALAVPDWWDAVLLLEVQACQLPSLI